MSTLAITDPTQPPQSALPPPPPERQLKRVRRDVEVGIERFTFAERQEIDRIVTAIYRAVQGVDDMYMRPACWENIVFVGNGSRIRGLRDNIMQTLHARHLVSPSTATMFTSELPSNVATPSGTGAQTPTGAFTNPPHQLGPSTGSGVNPLLQAATTASLNIPRGGIGGDVGTPGGPSSAAPSGPASNAGDLAGSAAAVNAAAAAGVGHSAHFHAQTPTSIKLLPLPTYLGEWTKNGFEEAMFLGAQVAARLAICIHSNVDVQTAEAQRFMSLGRIDYK
jgi:actin-related protein 9